MAKKDDFGPAIKRLEKWLAKHRRRFLAGLRPGATPAELAALAKAISQPIPGDLQALLSWRNGQGDEEIGYFEEHWLFMGTAAIAAASSELKSAAAKTGWKSAWIPFLDDDGGGYRALDTASPAAPVREFLLGQTEHETIAPSLAAWLRDFVEHLEKGKYHEEPERGTLDRSGD